MMHEKSLGEKLKMFHSYFMKKHHEDPGELIRNDPQKFAEALLAFEDRYSIAQLANIQYKNNSFPIWEVGKKEITPEGKKFLVCSGIHGDEQASIEAIPHLLQTGLLDQFPTSNIKIITPINPVGAAHSYHYNGQGLDINKDLRSFKTEEAQVLAQVIDGWKPDFILNLHEGPQDGSFLICNSHTPINTAERIAQRLSSHNVPLAEKSFLMTTLNPPGVMPYSSLVSLGRLALKLHSIGYYADVHKIPSISFESPIHSPLEERVAYQAAFVRSSVEEIL